MAGSTDSPSTAAAGRDGVERHTARKAVVIGQAGRRGRLYLVLAEGFTASSQEIFTALMSAL